MKLTRYLGLGLVSVFVLSACAAGSGGGAVVSVTDTPDAAIEPDTAALPDNSAAPKEGDESDATCDDPFNGTPNFNPGYWDETNFCEHSVDYASIISGGPPPDGIPPIDNPRFESVESADAWLEDVEPVISFEVNGDARAYPLQIMTWHEIVNDEVGGVPAVVTFCPLCNTALAFERPVIDGELLDFGTSGNLRNSDLVMYDRQTESWWQQFSGEAIVGDLTGTRLQILPASIKSWEGFKENHPDGQVLSIDTGFNRDYGRNPYVGYDDINSSPFLFRGEVDDQQPPMARVVGILNDGGESRSYLLETLREKRVINDQLENRPIVVFWTPGTASALDSRSIPEGDDVGSSGVYLARADGQMLTFTAGDEGLFEDQQTGSIWNVFGEAVDGPLEGEQLEPIPHHDTFWFVWSTFQGADDLQQ